MNKIMNFAFVLTTLLCASACKKKTVASKEVQVESSMTKERISGVLSDADIVWDANDIK